MEIKSIIKLANLEIEEKDLPFYQKEVGEVIDYNINTLKDLDLENTTPVFGSSGLQNLFAPDEPKPSLSNKEVLQNTKTPENGFFKIKAVLE